MTIPTALIDDELSHINSGILAAKTNNDLSLVWVEQINDGSSFNEWDLWCRNAAPEDLLVILDLKLKKQGNEIFPSALVMWEAIPSKDRDEVVPNTAEGICAGIAAMHSARIKRLLIIIASSAGELSAVQKILTDCAEQVVDKIVHIEFSKDNVTLKKGEAAPLKGLFDDAVSKWKKFFPTFHPDPWIDNCISKWIAFYRELDEKGSGHYFCQHGIADETYTIQGSAGEYIVALNGMFSLNGALAMIEDINGIKALLMLGAAPSGSGEDKQWFKQWPIKYPEEYDAKKVSKELLIPLLQAALEVDVDVQCNEMRLPSSPALPFVLSLRVLVQAISKEPKGGFLNPDIKVVLKENGGGYRLSIPLKQSEGKQFGLAKRWVEKVEQGQQITLENGVCAALWRVSLAKVNVSADAALNTVEQALLRLFDGPGRPVVGVSFAPHFIHLHWS